MEFLLIGLLLLAFPIVAIVALVKAVSLGDRLRAVEQQLAELVQRTTQTPEVAPAAAAPRPAAAPQAAPLPGAAPEPAQPESTPPPPSPAPPSTTPAAPEPEIGFEERFGTRWTVWIGGVALALGGIFLVKYSIEAGLIGPKLRLFFGALLAATLVAGGAWTRRKEQMTGFASLPTAHIPGILTAAGTTVAYATVYAAYALYGFLNDAFAFVLLAAVALATLAAALLHGPALAALGLLGAYVTPLLVASDEPNYWALYIYLAVVTAAAFALARMRLWLWLALMAIGFSLFWLLPGLQEGRVEALGAHLFHVAAGYALAAALIVAGLYRGPAAEPGKLDPMSAFALGAYLLGALVLVLVSGHDPAALTIFTLMTVATVAIAWRTEAAAATVPIAALFAAVVVIRWALAPELAQLIAAPGAAGAAAPQPWQADVGPHLALGFGYALLFWAGGYLAQGRSQTPVVPILWSTAAVAAPLLILIALYWRIAGFERSIPFAGVALLLAALNGVATEQLGKRPPSPGIAASGALYATGTVAALALALTFALEKGWLTVALALTVPGVAWIAEQRPLPMLRWLAAALAALVVARIGWEPRIVGPDVGTTPIFNWILYGYGAPALSFWVAGHLLRKRADDRPSRMVDAAAILFTVLLVSLEIRHFMTGGDIYRVNHGLAELALHVCAGLALAIGLEHVRGRTNSIVHDVGALLIAAVTFFAIAFGLWLGVNPALSGEPVGGPVVNLVLLGYGLPAVLAIALALVTRGRRPTAYCAFAASIAVLLMLSYLTLEVRTLYQGPVLSGARIGDAEQYTYSVVWLAYGVALLLFGIALRSQPARLASAAVTLLTVGKVFLIDMAGLTGVHRALSFIGLGLVLVGTGWVYQRLLFPAGPRPASPVPPDGTPPSQATA
jgi:uncharacterized membrane protein